MNATPHTRIIITVICLLSLSGFVRAEEATSTTATDTSATLSLTIRDCIDRALQNNLDIRIQRINPSISSWGVVSAQSQYDPTFTARATYRDSLSPGRGGFGTSISTNGPFVITNITSSTRNLSLQPTMDLGGNFVSGARYDMVASPFGSGPNRDDFSYDGSTVFSLTQPLLKNFGFDVNTAQIRIGRKNKEISIQNFVFQVINTLSSVQTAYYELVFTVEAYKARLEDLTQAKQLLDETRRKVQIGVSSPLEVTTAESGVASREEAVIVAERLIKDSENALKLLISQEVSEFRGVTFVPVDYPVVEMVDTDVARSTRIALETRPDYLAARESVERQKIQVKFSRNQLWPEVDLAGSYGWNGQGGGLGNWAGDIGSGDFPVWSAGVVFSFPLGNRQARANYQSARLQVEQLLLNLKQTEQQIIISVDNAVGHVQSSLKSVDAATAARRAAEASYQAERTKLQAGTSTTLNVVTQGSNLADARSAEIRARASYMQSLITLAQTEGTTLLKNNITLDARY